MEADVADIIPSGSEPLHFGTSQLAFGRLKKKLLKIRFGRCHHQRRWSAGDRSTVVGKLGEDKLPGISFVK
jgi:hypothetical protein